MSLANKANPADAPKARAADLRRYVSRKTTFDMERGYMERG